MTGRSGSSPDAVIVGSGPNGLAAAITLAQAGREVVVFEGAEQAGGGLRSGERGEPGFVHDICSAVHPLGVASPYFSKLPLERYGVRWVYPEVACTHPIAADRAAEGHRDLDQTVAGFAGAGQRYRRLVAPLVRRWTDLLDDLLGPLLRFPSHPLTMARFGLRGLPSAAMLARTMGDGPGSEEAKGLIAGTAAHSMLRLNHAFTGGVAVMFLASIHGTGWPVVAGGSGRLASALVALLEDSGGRIELARPVRSLADIPPARVVLFDTTPRQLAAITADRLPSRTRRCFAGYPRGPAAFKVDYTLDGPVPWRNEASRGAGTVHVGGTFAEVAAAEAAVVAGGHPDKPFVLVAQQSVADPERAPEGKHTLWAYCHVPNGSTVDRSTAIEAQIERFAPGFRDLIRTRFITTPADLEAYNPNYLGGDIAGGSLGGIRALVKPTVSLHPYRTPDPGIFLCSASTPPGAGVHGMCGHRAALDALATGLS